MSPEFFVLMTKMWECFKNKKSVIDTSCEIESLKLFNFSDIVCYPTVEYWFEEFRIYPAYYETHIPNNLIHADLITAFLKTLIERHPAWPVSYLADALRDHEVKVKKYLKRLEAAKSDKNQE